MRENKNSCPVCFTKMRPHQDGLICPECGYKLCDHRYKSQDIYDTNHVHTPEYTSAYPAARTGSASNPAAHANTASSSASHAGSTANSAPRAGSASNPAPAVTREIQTNIDPRAKKGIKIVRTFIIIYIIGVMLSVFGSMFSHLF